MRWYLPAVLLLAVAQGEEICLTTDDDPYLLFGTKTAYPFAKPNIPNTRVHEVFGCKPMAFWLLNRHGSHNPEAEEIEGLQALASLRDNIISNYDKKNFLETKERFCAADESLLKRWQYNPRHNLTFAGDLTSDGYMTAQNLAQAWRSRYPMLLTENRRDYLFKYVNEQRSATAFRAFTEGLFRAQAESYGINKENDEKLLRPYKSCPAWSRDVDTNNATLEQLHIFQNKHEYREMISNISRRLGFNYDVTADTIYSMYNMCRYNKAWDIIATSPWCSVFTSEDLRRLEYAEDLEMYYKFGPGSSFNAKLGCTLVKDMMEFFEKHINNPDVPQQPLSQVHFTDAAMFLLTHTALGATRPRIPLTGDNYRMPQIQERKWSTSTITPFNANLAAVLYKCEVGSKYQVNEQYQVLFLENEHLLYLENCRVGLCDWSLLQQRFGDVAKQCDLEFCNGANSLASAFGVAIAVAVFLFRFEI